MSTRIDLRAVPGSDTVLAQAGEIREGVGLQLQVSYEGDVSLSMNVQWSQGLGYRLSTTVDPADDPDSWLRSWGQAFIDAADTLALSQGLERYSPNERDG